MLSLVHLVQKMEESKRKESFSKQMEGQRRDFYSGAFQKNPLTFQKLRECWRAMGKQSTSQATCSLCRSHLGLLRLSCSPGANLRRGWGCATKAGSRQWCGSFLPGGCNGLRRSRGKKSQLSLSFRDVSQFRLAERDGVLWALAGKAWAGPGPPDCPTWRPLGMCWNTTPISLQPKHGHSSVRY